jgi:hypothetical protein
MGCATRGIRELGVATNVRKVVDSNFLQTDALKAYLSASRTNYAVLTEYVAMEAYKQNAVASLQSNGNALPVSRAGCCLEGRATRQ